MDFLMELLIAVVLVAGAAYFIDYRRKSRVTPPRPESTPFTTEDYLGYMEPTVENLMGLPKPALINIAITLGIEATGRWTKQQIVDAILEQLGS